MNVSAKTKEGIDKLLEMLSLQAEMLELKANPNKAAKGHVVEARLDRARGAISTILVEEGTLRVGDLVVAGEYVGKIRAMLGDKGQTLTEAGPSTPVEVLGLDGVPDAGEIVQRRHRREGGQGAGRAPARRAPQEGAGGQRPRVAGEHPRQDQVGRGQRGQGRPQGRRAGLDRGGRERADQAVDRQRRRQRHLDAASAASPSRTSAWPRRRPAIVIGFNVRPAGKAQQLAEQEGVDIKLYQVIYDAIDDVKKAMVGMLAPITREKVMGKAEVRQVFNIPKAGTIAGSFVTEGKITRKAQLRLVRDSVVLYTGKVGSLRRFKDDVSEVAQGYECGLSIEGYGDLREGDVIEAFEIETVAPTLENPGGERQAQLARLERGARR